jgi:hypothetical protein
MPLSEATDKAIGDEMQRLALLLVLFAWIGVNAAVHQSSAASQAAWPEITAALHAVPAVTTAGRQGFRIRHMPGRGGRRCNDPVIAHGSGACSE